MEWRRNKVVELRSRGLSQTEIANELKISRQLVNLDMRYLRSQAKENIKQYVTEHLPEQYQICLLALDTVIKNAFEIMQQSDDDNNHDKLQALQLFKDTHIEKLELLSDAGVIDHALHFIRNKQKQVSPSPVDQENSNEEKEQQKKDKTESDAADASADTETTAAERQTETVF